MVQKVKKFRLVKLNQKQKKMHLRLLNWKKYRPNDLPQLPQRVELRQKIEFVFSNLISWISNYEFYNEFFKFQSVSKRKKIQKRLWDGSDTDSDLDGLSESSWMLKDHLDDEAEEEKVCLVCYEYGKDELWFRCRSCGRWAHKECTNASSAEDYFCDYCSM